MGVRGRGVVWRGIILERAAPCGARFSALHHTWVATMIALLCLEGHAENWPFAGCSPLLVLPVGKKHTTASRLLASPRKSVWCS